MASEKLFNLPDSILILYESRFATVGRNRLSVQNCTVNRTQNCVVVFGIEDSENQRKKFLL